MAFTMVVPLAGERMISVLGRQWFLGLKMINDGVEFVDIVAALVGKLEVFEKTAGGSGVQLLHPLNRTVDRVTLGHHPCY